MSENGGASDVEDDGGGDKPKADTPSLPAAEVPKPPSDISEKPEESAKRGAEAAEPETPSQKRFWSELNIREWITAGAALAAAVAAIAGIVIAWLTYRQLDAQRAIMQGQLEDMHIAQRPWIACDQLILTKNSREENGGYNLLFTVSLKNTGASVATDAFLWMKLVPNRGIELKRSWLSLNSDFAEEQKLVKQTPWPLGFVIAPGQSVTQTFGMGGPANRDSPTLEEVNLGNFYVMGYVQYRDQFKAIHHTRFSFNPNGDSVTPWDGKTVVVSGGFQESD